MEVGIGRRLVGKPAPNFELEALDADGTRFTRVGLRDYGGSWLVLFFYPMDFTFVCPTELTAFSDRLGEFEQAGAKLLAVSTDSKFCHRAWVRDGLGELGYPMASDQTLRTCADYGVLLEEEGVALRGLFLIDPEGMVRYCVIHDNDIGRSPEEILRVLAALQSGGLCGAGWVKGAEHVRPDPPRRKSGPERPTDKAPVTLYTRSGCSYCRRTKDLLNELGVSFREIDLDQDKAGQAFMARRGYTALPVVVIGETEISGFDLPRVRKELGVDRPLT